MASQSIYKEDRGKKKLKMVVGNHSFCKRLREICGLRLDFRGRKTHPYEGKWLNEWNKGSVWSYLCFIQSISFFFHDRLKGFHYLNDYHPLLSLIFDYSIIWFSILSFLPSYMESTYIVLACFKVKVLLSSFSLFKNVYFSFHRSFKNW